MLTVEQNQKLTQVGPGTPGRCADAPLLALIAAVGELDARPTKAVRLLGEDLVLYKDNSHLRPVYRHCPHRRVDLSYGIPEEHNALHVPRLDVRRDRRLHRAAPSRETVHPDGRFTWRRPASPVTLCRPPAGPCSPTWGPQPAPCFRAGTSQETENVLREVFLTELPVNWLQCQENR